MNAYSPLCPGDEEQLHCVTIRFLIFKKRNFCTYGQCIFWVDRYKLQSWVKAIPVHFSPKKKKKNKLKAKWQKRFLCVCVWMNYLFCVWWFTFNQEYAFIHLWFICPLNSRLSKKGGNDACQNSTTYSHIHLQWILDCAMYNIWENVFQYFKIVYSIHVYIKVYQWVAGKQALWAFWNITPPTNERKSCILHPYTTKNWGICAAGCIAQNN